MHRRLALPAAVLLAAGVLTACGGGSSTDTPVGAAEAFVHAVAAADYDTVCSAWTRGGSAFASADDGERESCERIVDYAVVWWTENDLLDEVRSAKADAGSPTEPAADGNFVVVDFAGLGPDYWEFGTTLRMEVYTIDGELYVDGGYLPS